ncbi:YcaO-like family protein [Sandaracinus amylolyticus]|uniref:YcaO-like family protein n=1 Tax=Sandaracinus amylolyticus TaxID=927083 RepID=UPI001F45B036|nr:YcaO-like family protein [Sandaracinus amylolyticus]UJR83391.1 Hypothetical protein I5071_54590 [Sandaracinus amylolyticus]
MRPGAPSTSDADRWRDVLASHRRAFGVTRFGSTTALDVLGIETATALRDDVEGESISVASGKGRTRTEAEAGALAEALERHAAEPCRARIATHIARAAELGDAALDLASLALGTWVDRDVLDAPLEWCRGAWLATGEPVWVPADLVFFPFVPAPDRVLLAAPSTTGLASGETWDRAVLHGLLECVERDAWARALALVSIGRGGRIPHLDAAATPLLERVARAGLSLVLHDLTHDLGIPSVLAVIDDGSLAHVGAASHLRAEVALERAVLEAAQSRVTDLQGAREDLAPRGERPHRWFVEHDRSRGATWPASVDDDDLDARLRAAGLPGAITIDLSPPDVPAFVARVVAPGLESWALDPTRAGARLRSWLRAV